VISSNTCSVLLGSWKIHRKSCCRITATRESDSGKPCADFAAGISGGFISQIEVKRVGSYRRGSIDSAEFKALSAISVSSLTLHSVFLSGFFGIRLLIFMASAFITKSKT